MIMGSSLYLSMITCLLSLLACFHLIISAASSSTASIRPLCRDDESSALSQFNRSFVITDNQHVSSDPSAYPKTASWKLGDSSDCCSWDGVECDDDTGHVIGLDLSSSCLHGPINSSSSLFRLVHLQKLNLADNHFNYSQIPSRFGHLSRLTYLNLSNSAFSGQIPTKIFQLSKLISLDLMGNQDSSFEPSLKLEKEASLNGLLGSLTNLKELNLGLVNISSEIPDILANMTSLESLRLGECGLHGEFPMAIFQLPNLQVLDVESNPYLTGYLPEFNKSSPLELLKVARTGFFGKLPDSIGNLNSMKELDIKGCNFSGSVPSSLGNITQLTSLDISLNHLCDEFPMAIFQLPNLQVLDVRSNPYLTGYLPEFNKSSSLELLRFAFTDFSGKLPDSISNLNSMKKLDIYACNFSGSIPSSLGNITLLTLLDISYNHFHGSFPRSISRLRNLEWFSSMNNDLSGTVDFNIFLNLENLVELQLANINLSFLTNNNINATIRKFTILGLAECNLSEFPDFLRHQDELESLNLTQNKIQGQIPKWMWNVGKETLLFLWVSNNFLTGFDEPLVLLPWTSIILLDLSSNMLKGSLPIPPPSTETYFLSNNLLTGKISPLICNLTSLYVLDLSNNNFNNILPECLGNYSDSLSVLNLRNNNFHGAIPQICTNGSKLRMIDFNQNQLQGRVPRSLANCEMLEILDLGNNQINDSFPSWLETSPKLRVLILRSNEFHGAIKDPKTNLGFPKLHIIDLSHNNFVGKFPSKYFKNWNSMKIVDKEKLTYMQANISFGILCYNFQGGYEYGMTITNKGTNRRYSKIPNIFIVIDLSSNRFEGDIPESIGNLKGLQLLNLSNNILTGHIPSCLGNLTYLESLDLSQNKLSGEIPQQLVGITFLSILNLSHNHLTGPIPLGNQFDTFPSSSFEGNSGLCGNPLLKKCENFEASSPPPLTSKQDEDSKFPCGYDWIFILAGYGSGLVVGLVIGHILTTKKHEWFVETFRRKPRSGRRGKRGWASRST